MPPRKKPTPPALIALRAAVEVAGGQATLAHRLAISQQAVSLWLKAGRVPIPRALDVEAVTGISRYDLRPDIFGARLK